MSLRNNTTLRNVPWQDLSGKLLEKIGFDLQKDKNKRFTLTMSVEDQPQREKASLDEVMKIVEHLQALPVINPNVTQDSLYDKYGLPK